MIAVKHRETGLNELLNICNLWKTDKLFDSATLKKFAELNPETDAKEIEDWF